MVDRNAALSAVAIHREPACRHGTGFAWGGYRWRNVPKHTGTGTGDSGAQRKPNTGQAPGEPA